jgi:hypothetical protein
VIVPVVVAVAAVTIFGGLIAGFVRPADAVAPAGLLLGVAFGGLGFRLVQRRELRRLVGVVRSTEPTVPEGILEAPEPKLAVLIADVRRLGFELAGATDTLVSRKVSVRTWVLTEPDGRIWVEVGVAGPPQAIFLSQSADGRFLETTSRPVAAIDHPDLFVQSVATGPADALELHRRTLAEWTAARGVGRTVRSLEDFLAVEPEVRARTGGLRLEAHVARFVEPALRRWALASALASATAVAVLGFLAASAP